MNRNSVPQTTKTAAPRTVTPAPGSGTIASTGSGKSLAADPPPSIGPGSIATPGTAGGPAFALTSTNWIAIQTYVIDGLALPTTDDAFKTYLGKGAPSDLSEFKPLLDCFVGINSQCSTWQKTTYPASVSLASDIYDYGTNKAPTFYPPINKLADILTADPTNADALAKMKALLDNLTADAQSRADKAAAVKAQIQTFADQTSASKSILSGTPDNPGGLVKKYNDEFGAKSQDVIDCNKEITAQKLILDAANEEYNHDVIVAATTPTYAWVWPVGTIAAAVVAGIYGKKATDALDRANAAKQKIQQMNDQLAADALMMIAINSAEAGMGSILNSLNAALPIIQLLEGVWGGIADDLKNLVAIIDTDIRKALPILASLGVDEALLAWHNVALAANAYRTNAYVQVS
jgi:hypothetical protein